MKKILLLPAFFLLSGLLFAQQFKAGLLAGIVTSQVDGDTYAGYSKAGIRAGGFVTRRFASESKWSAYFEIAYIQKGSRKIPHPDRGDYAEYKLNLNYVEVPVLVKYNFSINIDSSSDARKSFTIVGGLALGELVNSSEADAFGQVTGGTPFQKQDISTVVGLNYSLSEHIGFDMRTEYSILPVRKGGTSSYYQNWTFKYFKPGYYNNLIIFSIYYRL